MGGKMIDNDGRWLLVAECSLCGNEEEYKCDATESETLNNYICYGRQMGYLQDLFPKVPNWIRSACIDQYSGGFCFCPECSPKEV